MDNHRVGVHTTVFVRNTCIIMLRHLLFYRWFIRYIDSALPLYILPTYIYMTFIYIKKSFIYVIFVQSCLWLLCTKI